jgi:hypothetical protein
VALKAKTVDNRSDEVQEELQKEGAGARKKSRLMGARENIGNAIWKDTGTDTCASNAWKSRLYGKSTVTAISSHLADCKRRARECPNDTHQRRPGE